MRACSRGQRNHADACEAKHLLAELQLYHRRCVAKLTPVKKICQKSGGKQSSRTISAIDTEIAEGQEEDEF